MSLPLQTLDYLGMVYILNGTGAYVSCPFHEEDTPSLHMDAEHGVWKCFGCDQGGSFMDFVTKICHGDELAALGVVRRARASVSAQVIMPRDRSQQLVTDPLVGWSRFRRVDWAREPEDDAIVRYLVGERRFSRDTLNAFDVRRTAWSDYPIAFQIFEGKTLLGYVRRRVDAGHPKYRYNAGFRADDAVAYYSIDNTAPCLVVEGILDLMKAAQFGYRRSAALLGWRPTPKKVERLLSLGVRDVVCALDNTETGRLGAAQLLRLGVFGVVTMFEYPTHRKDVGELSPHEFMAGLSTLAGVRA